MHLRLVVTGTPKHLNNFAHRRHLACGRMDDFHNHLIAVSCTMQVSRCNGDVLAVLLVVSEKLRAITREDNGADYSFVHGSSDVCSSVGKYFFRARSTPTFHELIDSESICRPEIILITWSMGMP